VWEQPLTNGRVSQRASFNELRRNMKMEEENGESNCNQITISPDLASTPDLKEYRGILEKEIQDSPDAWLTLKSYIS
jgi:hypothetical protein